jgi:hypothetical protein
VGEVSRNVQIVLLCEDQQHEAFARRFLDRMGWSTRRLRIEKAASPRGSAEQFVRERFPRELAAYRTRRGLVGQALVVMLDGDSRGLSSRQAELDGTCKARGIRPRELDERVVVLVPTWRIESWFAYLDGETINEKKPDYPRLKRPRDCQRHVDVLVEMCRDGQLRKPAPPSLSAACEEYNRRLVGPSN